MTGYCYDCGNQICLCEPTRDLLAFAVVAGEGEDPLRDSIAYAAADGLYHTGGWPGFFIRADAYAIADAILAAHPWIRERQP